MDVLIPAEQIHTRLDELAAEITRAYDGKPPVTVVGILNGCLMFVADLVRRIDLPLRLAFVTASSYRGATTPGKLVIHDDLLPELAGRHVLLLDDILDTGKTLTRVVAHLLDRGAASVKVGVLLRKVGRQEVPFEPDFVAFTIPDKFVVGYGLDYDDEYRHLPYIGVLEATGA